MKIRMHILSVAHTNTLQYKHTNEQLLSTKQQQTAVRKVTATLNANGNAILQYATKYANQSANNQDAPPDAKS